MGFTICYEKNNEKYKFTTKLEESQSPNLIYITEDNKDILVGEYYDCNPSDIINSDWRMKPEVINDFCFAGYIIHFDEEGFTFATDNSGRELLYYYHDDQYTILSNSFWAVLKIVKPQYSDILPEVIKEMIVNAGGVPVDHSTPIKNLYWAGPNIIGRFSLLENKLTTDRFATIQRTAEVTDLNEAVKQMDLAMKNMAKHVAEAFPGKKIGLGLSGGLDSRVALHYLKQANIDLVCFNTTTTRPHKILLANNVKRERALAAAANVSCREVEWKPQKIYEKMNQMLRMQPLGTGGHYTNVYKYEPEGLPNFDILLTAGQGIGPYLVGVSAPVNSDLMNRNEIIDYLMTLETENAIGYSRTERAIRKQLHKLGLSFIDYEKGYSYNTWLRIVGKDTYNNIKKKVTEFVDSRLQMGYRPADITLDFRTTTLGAIGRNGAYESSLGRFRNLTIYIPFLIKDGLKWEIKIVEDRKILKELIKKKIPEFASIGEEDVGSVIGVSSIGKFFNKLEFVLRGSGIQSEEWYANDKVIKQEFYNDFQNDCKWFWKLISTKVTADEIWKLSSSRKNSVWEIKRLLDCIERHDYDTFVSGNGSCY